MVTERRRTPAGFTIIELLVTIGVIGLLLGILLPTLAAARRPAQETQSLSNVRGVAQTIDAHRAANADRYPLLEPGVAYQVALGGGGATLIYGDDSGRWDTSSRWWLLVRDVAPWEEHAPAWLSPGVDRAERLYGDTNFFPSYVFSASFLADPAVWSEGAAPTMQMVRGTRGSMVAHPGQKVLVWDNERAYLRGDPTRLSEAKTPMAFADGHGALHHIHEATPGFPNPLREDDARPLHNTPRGVLGIDY